MSIATDLQALYTNLQGVLDDCNAALVNKGGAEVDVLSDVPAEISALSAGGSGSETDTPATGGAVNGTRHEFTINMTSNTYTGSVACTLQPERYLVKVWTDTPIEEMVTQRLVCAYVLVDSSNANSDSHKVCRYNTGTAHTADNPVLTSGTSGNLPTFDGTTFSWNVGAYFNKGTDYHLVVIDLSDDL